MRIPVVEKRAQFGGITSMIPQQGCTLTCESRPELLARLTYTYKQNRRGIRGWRFPPPRVQVVQAWVVRVLGPASAYAIVPMVLDKTTGSSWMLAFSQRADVAAD